MMAVDNVIVNGTSHLAGIPAPTNGAIQYNSSGMLAGAVITGLIKGQWDICAHG